MKVSEYQINAVIKTYIKNSKEKLTDYRNKANRNNIKDAIDISETGKKMYYEKIKNQSIHKMQAQMSLGEENMLIP